MTARTAILSVGMIQKTMADRVLELFSDNHKADRIQKQAYEFALDYSFTSVKKELEDIYFN